MPRGAICSNDPINFTDPLGLATWKHVVTSVMATFGANSPEYQWISQIKSGAYSEYVVLDEESIDESDIEVTDKEIVFSHGAETKEVVDAIFKSCLLYTSDAADE